MSNHKIDITRYADELEKLALQLKSRHEIQLQKEALASAGYEVLQELANSGEYDSARGEFWPWAYKRVLRRMIEEVSKHGGYSRRQQAARRANLAALVTARPTAEVAERDRFKQSAERDHPKQSARDRFMARWAVVDSTALGYQLELEADAMTPEDELLATERKQLDAAAVARLLASLKRLPERHRKMIIQRYMDEEPVNAVARSAGISKSRASHLLKEVREKLRRAVELGPEP